MKQVILLMTLISLALFDAHAQLTTKFICPGANVIAYKLGTSCTYAPFNFYTINSAGVQAATPFYTLTATDKEVNGMGINSVDRYLYAIEYDRSAACAFSNFHLMRYDAAGQKEDLGIVPPTSGATVQAALGCVSLDGHFIYSVTDASGIRYLAHIDNIASLPASPSTVLSATYKKLTNSCAIASYADWAVDPATGKLFTYGIYNNGGVSTGTVMEINPVTGNITCVGTPNSTEFLDVARDNFGGVYFAGGGILYGANVNTRKLYRIDVTTGAITYISQMSGAGQMRADMGSCDNGTAVLPIHFTYTNASENNDRLQLRWQVGEVSEVNEFQVEQQDVNGMFALVATQKTSGQTGANFQAEMPLPSNGATFRVTAITKSGSIYYSSRISWQKKTTQLFKVVNNPIANQTLCIYANATMKSQQYFVLTSAGTVAKTGKISIAAFGTANISMQGLAKGLYYFKMGGETEAIKIVVQ